MTFHTPQITVDDFDDYWPYEFQQLSNLFTPYGNTYGQPYRRTEDAALLGYLRSYTRYLQRVGRAIHTLYEQRYLDTATGAELAKLSAAVGVTRGPNETDDRFRFRIQLAQAVAVSNGTAEDIKTVLKQVFDKETLSTITFERQRSQPVVDVEIPTAALTEIPVSTGVFEQQLARAFPCGYGVRVITTDSFLLGESGSQGIGEGELV